MNRILMQERLKQFFIEDMGNRDVSATSIFPADVRGTVAFIAKEEGIFCGGPVIQEGFQLLDATSDVQLPKKEGEVVTKGETLAVIEAPIHVLLSGERVILNLVQRMSGIATLTHRYVQEIQGTNASIADTRKTAPGLRMFDKYAVRQGGGKNHRIGLFDAVMLKDNHIAFCGSITKAVEKARQAVGHTTPIEVEIETKEAMDEAVRAGADIIMFDNRTPEEITAWIRDVPSSITTEASGMIQLSNVASYAQTGVDYISIGALTHSVRAFDMSAQMMNK